ncbi:MAG TPA: hypothetical protein VMV45_05920 [Casimicrobiaceae bacterium]|nr:hypothetical protein [Casimicrobiaceae bacterium]
MRIEKPILHAAFAAMLVAGCATTYEPFSSVPLYNRYSIDDIVAMAQRGEPSGQIIGKLQASNGFYPLRASDYVILHERGVPNDVLDYLQQSYVRQVRREERFQLPQRFYAPF